VAGEAVDERAVGTALWSVLAALAQSGPVLIVLDDLPYMDAASAGAFTAPCSATLTSRSAV
jgi:hypothetical protein